MKIEYLHLFRTLLKHLKIAVLQKDVTPLASTNLRGQMYSIQLKKKRSSSPEILLFEVISEVLLKFCVSGKKQNVTISRIILSFLNGTAGH